MKSCDGCGASSAKVSVPYVVHESEMARGERNIKRLWIALIVAVALIFVSNALWLLAWSQYDYAGETYDYEQDGSGANIIGDGNEVNNGATTENPQEN